VALGVVLGWLVPTRVGDATEVVEQRGEIGMLRAADSLQDGHGAPIDGLAFDAGARCGANFNGLLATAGITIVAGHEMAETETDQFPSTGWLDSGGAENGDKCAWITTGHQGAAADISLSTGSFPVQSLWSNATSSCVLSY
jgi:hypothetical protein